MLATSQNSPLAAATADRGVLAYLPLFGRLSIAAIFLLSGFSKVTAPSGTVGYIASAGLPLPELALILAILVELVGGALLIGGYKTRLVAAALAVFTIAAAIFFHAPVDQDQFVHFFKNLAIAGGLIQVVAFGAGRFSIDNRG